MTRKRFIKLAMSHGMSRNEAQRTAVFLYKRKTPYDISYYLMFRLEWKIDWSDQEGKLYKLNGTFYEFNERIKQEEIKRDN